MCGVSEHFGRDGGGGCWGRYMKHKYRITDKRARKGQQQEAKEKQKRATINTDKAANKYIDTQTHGCACPYMFVFGKSTHSTRAKRRREVAEWRGKWEEGR